MRLRDEAGLDPWVHARLASLCLATADRQQQGAIEAYAFRVLSPDDPDAWRKWASAQLAARQYEGALHSLEKYLALAGKAGKADAEVEGVIQSLRRVVHGDVAHAGLRTPASDLAR
jgi:tetratricopeptide (TPR) repeat protein